MLLARPSLVRVRCATVSQPAVCAASSAIVATIVSAFQNLPAELKGPALFLGDKLLCADLWRQQLDMEVSELGLTELRKFDLELWLARVVAQDGTPEQRAAFRRLTELLDEGYDDGYGLPCDFASSGYGLPADLMGSLAPQPFSEVEVYRSLGDLDVADDDSSDDEVFDDPFGDFGL